MDQEHDIIQSYRKRVDEFHLPLRDDGWEKLEKELVSPPVLRRMPYRWWAMAASVLLCLALIIPMFVSDDTTEIHSDIPQIGMDKPAATIPAIPVSPKEQDTGKRPAVSVVSQSTAIAKVEIVEEPSVSEPVARPQENTTPSSEESVPVARADAGPQPEQRPALSKEVAARKSRATKRASEGWSFGIGGGSGKTTSGMGWNNSGPQDENYYDPTEPYPKPKPDPDPTPDPDPQPNDPFERSLPQLRSASYSYVHRLPLTVGVSVRKSFTEEFGLESGLTYSYLYSDIKMVGSSGYVGSQRLHYLGLPLKANWTVYRKGPFSIYLSAGFLAEYCVSARQRIQNEWNEIDMNRWQFSLNASAGAELKLFRPLSVYLEPGVGYYFDSGNAVPSIRKERPWMFGLQLGLRFSY